MLRRSLCVSAVILAGVVGFAGSAKAQSVDVPFAGTILNSCVLVPVATGGTLIPNDDGTVLSSSEGTGAVSGQVTITCTGGGSVSVAEPVATLVTPTDGITLASTLELDGETLVGGVLGSLPIPVLTPVVATVDMTATRASGLPAGVYTYNVLVTATPD
jgi:hypothetical protein